MSQWQPIETCPRVAEPTGWPVLLYNPSLAADDEFPGHAVVVSNAVYAGNGNAARDGYTLWMPVPLVAEPAQPEIQKGNEDLIEPDDGSCPNCLGRGWVEPAAAPGMFVNCPACMGTGRVGA
ncbi:hypothetical protein [Pseudoxanthomonas winnipegensis]|uniref:hypothetical protein n=1 Tax=Pseudoxanthomonas winnipegensis TaxID=2480810 RepID=UPI00102DF945|nr:hypothetical protein [Pseudoxanthomonas winnipegensis]RZZ85671.1 hypothetical protein EA663_11715 [Pseudoxanthomonas winnipegensis]